MPLGEDAAEVGEGVDHAVAADEAAGADDGIAADVRVVADHLGRRFGRHGSGLDAREAEPTRGASGTPRLTILSMPPPARSLYFTKAMSGSTPVVSQSIRKAMVPVGASTVTCALR